MMSQRFAMVRFRMRRSFCLPFLPFFLFSSAASHPRASGAPIQDRLSEYKEKYQKETDPVQKAKALVKLGDVQIADFSKKISENDADGAFATLTAYREEVRSVFDGLKATGNNAERKPGGFKELQIHLRKTIWELDRSAFLVPTDRRKTFHDIREELGNIESELIGMLFPRQPGGRQSGQE